MAAIPRSGNTQIIPKLKLGKSRTAPQIAFPQWDAKRMSQLFKDTRHILLNLKTVATTNDAITQIFHEDLIL